jgi:hypothetical protein
MPSPSESTAQQKAPRGSSSQPTRVALICAVKSVRSHPTGDATVVAAVGGLSGAPHIHGLRASRQHWAEIISSLLKADPFLHAQVAGKLAAR